MEQTIKEKFEILTEPGPSNTSHNDSSSEYESDSSTEEVISATKNLNENYEDEIESGIVTQTNKKEKKQKKGDKSKKVRRNRSKLPCHLKGLMGEANLRFARGECSVAEKMCLEIVRQEAHAYEPYQTLAQIYDSKDKEKSIEFLTIAAHLNPSNADQWVTLGEYYCNIKQNIKGAVTCYTRAVRAQPKNYKLHLRRITLLTQIGDEKSVVRCKAHLLQNYSKKLPHEIITLAKELSLHYHKEGEYAKAVEAYSVPFVKCKKFITLEMVNIYLELLLLNRNYPECLDIFVQFCNIDIEVFINDENKVQVLSFNIPEGIQIDIMIKFVICLIKLNAFDLMDALLQPIIEADFKVEENGDLYLDVAEALMSEKQFSQALKMLIPLIKSKNFSLAAVWLKYADCLRECQMTNEAIAAYNNVVKLAPLHLDVRHPLAMLLIQAGRDVEALVALHQEPDTLEVDVELLIKEMEFLKERKKTIEYLQCMDLLLRRHCVAYKHKDELRQVTFQETFGEKIARLNRSRELKGEEPVTLEISSLREPLVETEYELYREALNFCYKNKYYTTLKKFCFYGLCSQRFKAYVPEITIVTILACLMTRDTCMAFPIIRDLLIRKRLKPNHRLWNLFNTALQIHEEMRQARFLMRQSKVRKYEFVKLLETCAAISSGSYRIASVYLLPYLKQHPTPYVHLLLGIVFLQMSCQKHCDMKKKMTQCCYGFFANYANKRGADAGQEVYYNLGRMYHQFGILHLAVHYYRQVLDFEHPLYAKYAHILDLKQEAAYNLYVIYRECDNFVGARNIMMKYLTI